MQRGVHVGGGISGAQIQLRAKRLELIQGHNEAIERRYAVVMFGMPYETLLGTICFSIHNAALVGKFLCEIVTIDRDAVRAYVDGFVKRIETELDVRTSEWTVKPSFINTPMDFPRPSATKRFLIPAFLAELQASDDLKDIAARVVIF